MEVFSQLTTLWTIFKNWWWLFLPFVLYGHFVFFWKWYKSEKFAGGINPTVFEIKIPKEVLKPIKAMEQVFAGFHGVHDVFTWKEKWLQGELQLSFSLEIVSIEGNIHFLIRASDKFKDIIESNIYSQYPDAEISIVEDYTKLVPPNIPNKDWDLFGFDFVNTKPSAYPIKTYRDFEDSKETKEEKRLDPLSNLLDGMATLGPGEHMWLQMIAKPVRTEVPWQEEGLEIVNELVHRDGKKKGDSVTFTPIVEDVANVLISGKPPGDYAIEQGEDEGFLPPEMKLTSGERDIVKGIEDKIGKFGFVTNIRFLYLGKKDCFFKPKARIPYGFTKNVSTENLGGLKPWPETLPKVQWFLKDRRTYRKKRTLFRRYTKRWTPLFPQAPAAGTFIFTTDELATLFHFPGRTVAPAPTVQRVEAKKKVAPSEVPFE